LRALTVGYDVAVAADRPLARHPDARVGEDVLQRDPADHARDGKALVHSGVEGVELDVPVCVRVCVCVCVCVREGGRECV
jgi:hypothetical protein